MAAEYLGQVLRERRPRQHHITSHFVRLLLQIALDVRQEADDRRVLLQLAFEFGDECQGFGGYVIQVEDNQRGLLFAILLHLLEKIFVGLHEFDLHIHLARGFLNFGQEEQIVNEGEDAGTGVFPDR